MLVSKFTTNIYFHELKQLRFSKKSTHIEGTYLDTFRVRQG
jgi:hypothetical protein